MSVRYVWNLAHILLPLHPEDGLGVPFLIHPIHIIYSRGSYQSGQMGLTVTQLA